MIFRKVGPQVLILACLCLCRTGTVSAQSGTAPQSAKLVPIVKSNRGRVPGDPANAVRNLENIYKYVQLYRAQNEQKYPESIRALFPLIARENGKQGMEGITEAHRLFTNPDIQYSRSFGSFSAGTNIIVYPLSSKRFDGSLVGTERPKGTKDLLSSTDIYHHWSSSHDLQSSSINPIGFYCVLWDDGQIEKIPFDLVLHASVDIGEGRHGYMVAFPQQAGIPAQLLTYQEMNDSGFELGGRLIGKPLPEGKDEVIPDNGGPEALVSLSRLLAYPNRYGIEREKLWQVFSPEQVNFTLQEIQTGAQQLGLALQPRKITLKELQELNAPAIFVTHDKRVTALVQLDDEEAILSERGITRIVSRASLEQLYNGEVLLPAGATASVGLQVEDPIRHLALPFNSPAREVEQTVKITNTGQQPLTLQIENPIPGVSSARLSADTIAPGESATLTLTVQWRAFFKSNPQNVFVFLKTSDPLRPRLPLGFQLQLMAGMNP